MQFVEFLHKELVAGHTIFDWCFLGIGLALQAMVLCLAPTSPVAVVSAIAGVFSVLLCSQGKISSFFFGFLQVLTYLYICFVQHLYGEVGINIFYFVSMIYGVSSWRKNYGSEAENTQSVRTRRLSVIQLLSLFAVLILLSTLAGWGLERFTNDPQPYLDAYTTIPSIAAQILMVLRYRDQWYIWLCVDILSVWMWWRMKDYSMVALYMFWCMNCVYGYRNWTHEMRVEA